MSHDHQHAESLFAGLLDQWSSIQSMSPDQMDEAVRALQAQHPAHASEIERMWRDYAAVDQALKSELRSMVAERARLDAQHQALLADLETTKPLRSATNAKASWAAVAWGWSSASMTSV
jgi:hypothetical protein